MTISGGRTEQHVIIAGFLPGVAYFTIFSGGTTKQHIIIGFGELATVD